MQKHELIAEVDVLLGGRAAEEVFIGEISTGAGNDLERATDIIKSMACVYGMSDIAGLMVLEKRSNSFIGGQSHKDYSDNMAMELDNYIKDTLNERYKSVLNTLNDHKEAIEQMTAELLETEVISGLRVREVIKENGGVVFEAEDLHSESLKKDDETKTSENNVKKDEKKEDSTETSDAKNKTEEENKKD